MVMRELEESEVQDDSDGEVRCRILKENIEGIQQQSAKSVKNQSLIVEGEDTEGESVLIGEEEPIAPNSLKMGSLKSSQNTLVKAEN